MNTPEGSQGIVVFMYQRLLDEGIPIDKHFIFRSAVQILFYSYCDAFVGLHTGLGISSFIAIDITGKELISVM